MQLSFLCLVGSSPQYIFDPSTPLSTSCVSEQILALSRWEGAVLLCVGGSIFKESRKFSLGMNFSVVWLLIFK